MGPQIGLGSSGGAKSSNHEGCSFTKSGCAFIKSSWNCENASKYRIAGSFDNSEASHSASLAFRHGGCAADAYASFPADASFAVLYRVFHARCQGLCFGQFQGGHLCFGQFLCSHLRPELLRSGIAPIAIAPKSASNGRGPHV